MAFPILCVGSVALDTVETPFGQAKEALGGSATYFSYSASALAPVRLVAVVGEDFPQRHLALLRKRRVDLSGLQVVSGGRTFRWHGKFGDNLNEAVTLRTELNVFETFRPEIPSRFRDSPVVFLANIDPELQMEVLGQVKNPKIVLCDTMNLWIETKIASLRKLLRRVDVITLNEGEARLLTEKLNLASCAREILKMGPRRVVIKRGEYGATTFTKDNFFALPAYPLEEIEDPTGAGDTFAGGVVGELARLERFDEASFRRALVRGSVHASFVVEGFSLEGLKRATPGARSRR
ncbi:MAG: PfkB family carbohydrate kinase, partial [Bdellovibrionota bacterium]